MSDLVEPEEPQVEPGSRVNLIVLAKEEHRTISADFPRFAGARFFEFQS